MTPFGSFKILVSIGIRCDKALFVKLTRNRPRLIPAETSVSYMTAMAIVGYLRFIVTTVPLGMTKNGV